LLFPYVLENGTVLTRICRQRRLEKTNSDHPPWTPENLDPLIEQYLHRRGLSTADVQDLQNTNDECSLTRGLIVLLQCFRHKYCKGLGRVARPRKNGPREIDPSVNVRIGVEELKSVQALYAKAEARRAAVQQPEAELTSSKIIQKESSETDDNEELTKEDLAFETIEENLDEITNPRPENDLLPSQENLGTLLDYQESFADCRFLVKRSGRKRHAILEEMTALVHHRFDSQGWIQGLLSSGQWYPCADHAHSVKLDRFFAIRGLSVKSVEGLRDLVVRVELAPNGEVHPHRFIRKWLPSLESAARLAIRGKGIKSDGSDFDDWLYDAMNQKSSKGIAERIFKANSIVDWLEGDTEKQISLKPRRMRYEGKKVRYTTSAVEFAEEFGAHWKDV
jgi:hypothetical protein